MWSNDRFSIIRTTMWSTFETRLRSASSSGTVVTPATDRPYPGLIDGNHGRPDWRKATQPGRLRAGRRSASSFTRAVSRRETFVGRLCSDGDPAEERRSRDSQHRCSRFVASRSPGVDPAGESLQLGLHAPARRSLDSDPTEQRVEGKPCSRRELDLAQVDRDATEPRQHRASRKGPGPALELDAIEDSDQAELVTLFVSPRGHGPPHERSSGHHPHPGAELEKEHPTKRTHRVQAYKAPRPRRCSPDQLC